LPSLELASGVDSSTPLSREHAETSKRSRLAMRRIRSNLSRDAPRRKPPLLTGPLARGAGSTCGALGLCPLRFTVEPNPKLSDEATLEHLAKASSFAESADQGPTTSKRESMRTG